MSEMKKELFASGFKLKPPPRSEEARARMSAASKARIRKPCSEETRRKISETLKTGGNHKGNTGRKFSAEHVARMVASRQATLARKRRADAEAEPIPPDPAA